MLDFERGGEAAKRLDSFYNVARALVMKAGVDNSTEALQELVAMFTRLRSAWAQAEGQVAPSDPTQRLRVSSAPKGDFSQKSGPPPETTLGSGSGGWRA